MTCEDSEDSIVGSNDLAGERSGDEDEGAEGQLGIDWGIRR